MNKTATILQAAALSAVMAAPASAVTFDILGTISNGIYAGISGTGTISWDETLVDPDGEFRLGPVGGIDADLEDPMLAIEFTAGGVVFTEMNDVDFPDFPTFDFVDGELDFINYLVVDGESGADLAQFGVLDGAFGSLFFNDVDQRFEVDVTLSYISAIPVPAGMPLLAGGLALLAWRARRKA